MVHVPVCMHGFHIAVITPRPYYFAPVKEIPQHIKTKISSVVVIGDFKNSKTFMVCLHFIMLNSM